MNRKLSYALLLAVGAGTACCIWLTSQLKFDYDFEKFFPHDHDETQYYEQFRKTFETDNDFIIVSLVNPAGVFQKDFLLKVDSLAASFSELPDMEEVVSPTRLTTAVREPLLGAVFSKPLLDIHSDSTYAADSARIWQHGNFVGTFFSADGKAIAINMKHRSGLSKKACDAISYKVEDRVDRFDFSERHIIGRSLGQRIYVDMMVDEMMVFVLLSALLTIAFLIIAFRNFWHVVLPTLVVIFSILWTLGIMKLIGKDIDIMLTVLPTIIFIIGMSDSVHILSGFLDELRAGKPKTEAIRLAMKKAGLATFLTAFTSSIGFVTLVFNSIKPISDFGIYTSVGVMLAFVLTYLMLPATLFLVPAPKQHRTAMKRDFWGRRMHRLLAFILRERRKVIWGALLLLIIGIAGIMQLEDNNYMLEDLQSGHRLKKEFAFVEDKFSGARPFEMAIELQPGVDPLDPRLLHQLDTLQHYLKTEYGAGILLSPVDLVKEVNRAWNGGSDLYYTLPGDSAAMKKITQVLRRKEFKKIFDLVINREKSWMRISGKVGDLGRKHFEAADARLAAFVAANTDGNLFTYRLTGTAVLIDLNNTYLTSNMLWGLISSVLIIGICMLLLFGDIRIGLISLLPNLLPLAIVAGIMGFAGITMKISTSIIFGIAFGIAVDDTIHFLARLRLLLGEGRTLPYAVKRTFLSTGKAMVVTSLILCAGFITLIFSDFMGTYYIGLLIGLTLLIAMVAELMLSPLLLLWLYKPSSKK
ncbi:MAG: MMPL family transporter [Flavobacteriales bacterium]|nr:MMPL family transporter [Flavobacteriales bacterium]